MNSSENIKKAEIPHSINWFAGISQTRWASFLPLHGTKWLRKILRRTKNLLHLDQTPDRGEWDTDLERGWTHKELWDGIAKLPKKQRTVVMMRIAQELSYRDIADITGMSEGSAKVNYHHAVIKLKDWLTDE